MWTVEPSDEGSGVGLFCGSFWEISIWIFHSVTHWIVPKDKVLKTRLIFHLSYPRDGDSVNSGIPKQDCSVKYPDFERAIELCIAAGVSCSIAKSDMSSAFRHVPLRPDQWYLMVIKATHPVSKKTYFFVDKCLPFGSSISSAIFQDVSDAIAFLV